MQSVTKRDIVKGLRELGLREGDIVVCHVSLSSFGKVAGGAATVVDALLETVGRTGTLLMPTQSRESPYDFRKSPSAMGAVTEEFRKRPGVVRSLSPCMPAAAYGPRAAEFVANHHKCECPYIGSPYHLTAEAGGYVLLLGVDQDRNTTLHVAEALRRVPYMNPVEARYVDESGRVRTYRSEVYAGPHRNFIGVDPKLRQAGILKMGRIGNCVVRLMKGRDLIRFCMEELKKDPALFITPNDGYYDGIKLRGMIRAARIARRECFTLIARTSSAGRNMEEVLWHAQRAGVSGLEVDTVDGRDISRLDEVDLNHLQRRMGQANLKAEVVRSNVLTDAAFSAAVRAARTLRARAVIAPLTGPLHHLKARAREARDAGLELLLENVAIPSEAVGQLMAELGKDAALAFNPAHFAAAGELPFLRSFRNRLKRYIRYLAITDSSPLGVPCLPGNGYGEVKEIVSILRCSSFDGFVSLGADPNAGLPFDGIADAFYGLLDAC